MIEGFKEGFKQGYMEGYIEGFKRGRQEAFLFAAKRVLRRGWSIEEVSDLTGLSRTELRKLMKNSRG